jgi:cytochrome P450
MRMSGRMQVMGSDIFDPMKAPNLQEPFLYCAKLREDRPVYWSGQYSFWMLTRYRDVKAALRAPRRFSSATGVEVEQRAEQIPPIASCRPEDRAHALTLRARRYVVKPLHLEKWVGEVELICSQFLPPPVLFLRASVGTVEPR